MSRIIKEGLNRKPTGLEHRGVEELRDDVVNAAQRLIDLASASSGLTESGHRSLRSLAQFERALMGQIMGLAQIVVALFLEEVEQLLSERMPRRVERGARLFRRNEVSLRSVNTLFGVVWYWRSYMRPLSGGDGFFPTDEAVGMVRDRMSFGLINVMVRLATKLSFGEARETLGMFVPTPPAQKVIETTTLGLGRYTEEYFRLSPPPSVDGPDGEILVIMFDGKGVPRATDEELVARRCTRPPAPEGGRSKRHRGRDKRCRRRPRKRRKRGDKSKNAGMATGFVMYTLRREGERLVGPLNVFRYASMAPKRHAFKVARREADKRGFSAESGRLIQIVVDGDPDLQRNIEEFFREATLTIDVMHVLEYIYKAGTSIFSEGSRRLLRWFDLQKDFLLNGEIDFVLTELRARLAAIPKKGPGKKARRARIQIAITYIDKRREHLNYGECVDQDLEIASGMMEGMVKHVIAKRFDNGGMRWIRERVEPLLHLRCIDVNGQWEDFMEFVQKTIMEESSNGPPMRLQQEHPSDLPPGYQEAA